MADLKIQCDVLLLVHETKEEHGNKEVLRVVRWTGERGAATNIEKRRMFWNRELKEWVNGKAKGFSITDLNLIVGKWDEIVKAMGGEKAEESVKEDAKNVAD